MPVQHRILLTGGENTYTLIAESGAAGMFNFPTEISSNFVCFH